MPGFSGGILSKRFRFSLSLGRTISLVARNVVPVMYCRNGLLLQTAVVLAPPSSATASYLLGRDFCHFSCPCRWHMLALLAYLRASRLQRYDIPHRVPQPMGRFLE